MPNDFPYKKSHFNIMKAKLYPFNMSSAQYALIIHPNGGEGTQKKKTRTVQVSGVTERPW
jgi:hypothetical protein